MPSVDLETSVLGTWRLAQARILVTDLQSRQAEDGRQMVDRTTESKPQQGDQHEQPTASLTQKLGHDVMGKAEDIWVELECRISEYRIRTFRGLSTRNEVERLVNGDDVAFLRLSGCYWYSDAEDESEFEEARGSFHRLGHRAYANFSGEMHIRGTTILNIAYLHGGFDNEPNNEDL